MHARRASHVCNDIDEDEYRCSYGRNGWREHAGRLKISL